MPVGPAKFDLNRCNESPLRGEKPDFGPVSKFNTGRLPLRGNPAGNQNEEQFTEQRRRPNKRQRQLTEQPIQPQQQQQRPAGSQRRGRVMITGKSKSPGHTFTAAMRFQKGCVLRGQS